MGSGHGGSLGPIIRDAQLDDIIFETTNLYLGLRIEKGQGYSK